jgi:UDP-N-acetylglucosamine--N-acetylmuramyl-(pentapeptide) pyrophosphoryl-undecaprenol N-acetylglucosamine transferase
VVAGGGTGGHVTPALALGECIASAGDRVLFLGADSGLEKRLVPDAGFDLVTLPVGQVMGRSALGRMRSLMGIVAATFAAARTLRSFGAECVISVGGYASVPAALAAVIGRIPVALVEPNAIPGRANRAMARFARRIFVHFDEAAAALGGGKRVHISGIPLRRALVDAFSGAGERRPPTTPLRVLVFGGSQGARQLNDAMIESAAELVRIGVEVFHQTGASDRDRVADAYQQAGVTAEVVPFEPEMPKRYAWADLAVCRSGALTVAELAMAGLPALLVPYPYAADNHQAANARALEAAGAARMLDAQRFDAAMLVAALESLIENPAEVQRMGAAAAELARPDAAARIVEECRSLLPEHSEGAG